MSNGAQGHFPGPELPVSRFLSSKKQKPETAYPAQEGGRGKYQKPKNQNRGSCPGTVMGRQKPKTAGPAPECFFRKNVFAKQKFSFEWVAATAHKRTATVRSNTITTLLFLRRPLPLPTGSRQAAYSLHYTRERAGRRRHDAAATGHRDARQRR